MEPWRKQFQEKGKKLPVKLLKSKIFRIISLYEEFFKLEVNYMHLTKSPNISQRIASGFLKSLKEGFSESLSFCAFQILNSTLNQYESKKSLSKLGFTIPQDISCNFTSQVQVFRKHWLEGNLFRKYPTDGIVVKINSRKLQLMREKSNLDYPYWQVAIKS